MPKRNLQFWLIFVPAKKSYAEATFYPKILEVLKSSAPKP